MGRVDVATNWYTQAHGIGPWFVGVGFIRPHVDWSAPQEFWDLYPEEKCGNDVAKHPTPPEVRARTICTITIQLTTVLVLESTYNMYYYYSVYDCTSTGEYLQYVLLLFS